MSDDSTKPAADCALSFENVSFAYEPREPQILHDVSFKLTPRSFTTIVGPSGAGKSTILRLATGLEKATSGTVTNHCRTRMIFQDAALLPWRTVRENVHLGFRGTNDSHAEREKRIHAELSGLGLAEFKDHYPRDLSGGQRQRVGIARALVSDPELLLLDEPFSALDIKTIETLSAEILDIFAKRHITMLMVSHDIEDTVQLADEIFVFSGGTISHKIPVTMSRPRTRDSAEVERIVKEVKNFITKA